MRQSTVAIIGAPLDLGAGRRGVDMGPSAIRVANIHSRLAELGYKVEDLGNVAADQAESLPAGPRRARYLPQIAASCRRLAALVEKTAAQGKVPFVIGGDHSVAVGTVSGMSRHFRKQGKQIGLLWVDAHTDMNTPLSSPSGNVHGMPLACLIGKGPKELTSIYGYCPKVNPGNVALVGIRNVDVLERPYVKKSGVHAFTMRDIDERGMREVMQEAIHIATAGTDGVHLSLDMDVVDPAEAPGVGTPVRGGISYREAHLAMEILGDSGSMVSLEVVEVNPVFDAGNKTAQLAVELALSAMGKRIL
jgi:arginase